MATKTFNVTSPTGLTRSFAIGLENEQSFQNLLALLQHLESYISPKTTIAKSYSMGAENHGKAEVVKIIINLKN